MGDVQGIDQLDLNVHLLKRHRSNLNGVSLYYI